MGKGFLIVFAVIAGLFFLNSCANFVRTNHTEARQVLETEGYTKIEFVGYDWLSCGQDDFYHTGFRAEKNGKMIRGTVCSGLFFGGSYIRY